MKVPSKIYAIVCIVLLLTGGCVVGVSADTLASGYVMEPWEEDFYEEFRDESMYDVGLYDSVLYPQLWFDIYNDENGGYYDPYWYDQLLTTYQQWQSQNVTVTTPTETVTPIPTESTTPTETETPIDTVTPTQTETVQPTATATPTPVVTPTDVEPQNGGIPILPIALAGIVVILLAVGAVFILKRKGSVSSDHDPLAVKTEPEAKPVSYAEIEIKETEIGVGTAIPEAKMEEITTVEPVEEVIEEEPEPIEEPKPTPEPVTPPLLSPKEAYAKIVDAISQKYDIPYISSLTPRQLLESVEPTAELTEFVKLYEQTRYSPKVNASENEKLSDLAEIIRKQYAA